MGLGLLEDFLLSQFLLRSVRFCLSVMSVLLKIFCVSLLCLLRVCFVAFRPLQGSKNFEC